MCIALTHRRTLKRTLEHFHEARSRNHVQFVPARSLVTKNLAMVNVFSAGQELVRWEVTAISDEGPYRLSVTHAGGAIVEYFQNVAEALQREHELEVLFTGSRATYEPVEMALGR
jgi:hypothetical protein